MSILIKGIDMPSKVDLEFSDNYILLGGVLHPIDIDQLVYIPTPHGRLIDGDKLSIEFENQCAGECAACMFEERCVIIDDIAPTILEAEE